jgi:tripartite-type tricarboxylate transporter receptor subunit TctC
VTHPPKEIAMKKLLTCLAGLLLGASLPAQAQAPAAAYPVKSVKVIVPYPPGGPTDIVARVVFQQVSDSTGQQFIVENRAGAGGNIGAEAVARAPADGYTLLVANSGSNGTVPTIMSVSYKSSDFRYVAMYGTQPMTLVVKADAPWHTLQELVADIKQNPGKYNYATSSVGAQSHFVMEMFKAAAGGLKIEHVPFRGAPESVTALLGGHVEVGSTYLADVKGQIDAGQLRILAVPEEKRLAAYPSVPTFAESGYPDVVSTAWFGVAAPAATPRAVIDKLEAAMRKVVDDPEVKKRLSLIGYTPAYLNSERFSSFVDAQEVLFTRVAKQASMKMSN